ncbi:MAG: hypothetical protein ACREBJ_10170 [Nitrosotalea sp.]
MGFTDVVKTIADLISEINKSESNVQQKRFLATLRRLERQINSQEKTAKKHLIIGIVASSLVSWVLGYFLSFLIHNP